MISFPKKVIVLYFDRGLELAQNIDKQGLTIVEKYNSARNNYLYF